MEGTSVRTVVVGVDGSAESERALRFAARLTQDLSDAELVVVFARYVPAFWLPDHVAEDEFGDLLDASAKLVDEMAVAELSAEDFPWRVLTREGEPSRVLCDVAVEHGSDTIVVVGRRSWSTVHDMLLGSVSNRLVHRGECSVLLVN